MKKTIFLFIGIFAFLFVLHAGNFTQAQTDNVWEDFEEGLSWRPVDWENVRQVELSLSDENVSSGSQALNVTIKEEVIG